MREPNPSIDLVNQRLSRPHCSRSSLCYFQKTSCSQFRVDVSISDHSEPESSSIRCALRAGYDPKIVSLRKPGTLSTFTAREPGAGKLLTHTDYPVQRSIRSL